MVFVTLVAYQFTLPQQASIGNTAWYCGTGGVHHSQSLFFGGFWEKQWFDIYLQKRKTFPSSRLNW